MPAAVSAWLAPKSEVPWFTVVHSGFHSSLGACFGYQTNTTLQELGAWLALASPRDQAGYRCPWSTARRFVSSEESITGMRDESLENNICQALLLMGSRPCHVRHPLEDIVISGCSTREVATKHARWSRQPGVGVLDYTLLTQYKFCCVCWQQLISRVLVILVAGSETSGGMQGRRWRRGTTTAKPTMRA